MAIAGVIGAVCGFVLVFVMYQAGMLKERSGLTILLAAIAFFYPVFAAAEGDWHGFILHTVVFFAFCALAYLGWSKGLYLIIGGLIAHGVFDFGLAFIGHPGPIWWPVFCGTLDIMAGVILLRLLQNGRIPI